MAPRCSTVCAVLVVVLAIGVLVVRRTLNPPMTEPVPQDMSGKVVIITGANAGVGRQATRMLSAWGAHVIMAVRTPAKAERVAAELKQQAGDKELTIDVMKLDLSSLASVRAFAAAFLERGLPLHVLMNNAGIAAILDRTVTEDGYELTFQTNHLGHFLLTKLLLDKLKASAPARVVSLSSDLHYYGSIDFDNLQGEMNYDHNAAYGNSKLANVAFTMELQRRLEGSGVTALAVHPGFVITELGKDLPMWMAVPFNILRYAIGRSEEQGGWSQVWAATAPELATVGGVYIDSCSVNTKVNPQGVDEDIGRKLWEVSEQLIS